MKRAFAVLRRYALAFPETREDLPWGESAIKVKGKTFLFMRADEEGLSLSVKLPQSAPYALDRPFAAPTGYGLGASGWVSAKFGSKDKPPLELLQDWIAESYRAVAPKKLLARQAGQDEKKHRKRPSGVNRGGSSAH
jgi:predicted DNA-binding protein (MmcQ/YjbR family)